MYKKTVKFTDYNGVERTEDCYFNLNKVECTELQVNTKDGYDKYISNIVTSGDNAAIFDVFNKIILKAYGKKSDDGIRFIKSKQLSEEFSQTEAYVNVFMEVATNPDVAEEFIRGVFPAEYVSNMPQPK